MSAFTLIFGMPGAGTLIDIAGMVKPTFMPSKKPPFTGQTIELSRQMMHRTIVWGRNFWKERERERERESFISQDLQMNKIEIVNSNLKIWQNDSTYRTHLEI